jgi:biotin carboxylase
MNRHVMVFGSGGDLPTRMRALADDVGTTLVCRTEHLHRLVDPTGHRRLVVLTAETSLDDCVRLARTVHDIDPVTHIATLGEHDQDRAAAVGAALGVATHSPEVVRRVHDKNVMRRYLRDTGIDDTPSELITTIDELQAFALRCGYPLVVKPAGGMASYGVSIVDNAYGLVPALSRAAAEHEGLASRGVLAERCHLGSEYSVESFSEGGEHVPISITKKYKEPVTSIELGHVVPAELPADDRAKIVAFTSAVLNAIGVDFGPTHTEIVLTTAGPRLIETHVRMGGDEIADLVHGATGVDMVDCQVRQCLGERVLPSIRQTLAAPRGPRAEAIWYATPPLSGELVEVQGVGTDTTANAKVTVSAAVGAQFAGLISSYSRPAYARAGAATAAEAIQRAREAIGSLTFITRVPATVSETTS